MIEPEPTGEAAEPRTILIISADIGEGHDLPARAVAREFREREPDAQISVVNGLPAMGSFMTKVLRDNSAFMFTYMPWWFDLQYRLFMNIAPTRWIARTGLSFCGRRGLMRLIRAHDPDLIVSTYPGVTAILGELRRSGRLAVPCYSSITDLAGLRFWAHPGIDLHFITHPESAEEVQRIAGADSVRWAKPPTSEAFMEPRARADARRALGLGVDGRVIAISGGGWGVGDLIGATEAALAIPDATVLCLCGRNDRLRSKVLTRFEDEPRLRVMGFTNRMGDVLAGADALVHSSAGLTVLEAIIRGCPVISYGFGYGHVRASNLAMLRFGLAQVVSRRNDLVPAIERALERRPEPDGRFARRPPTADLILSDKRRVAPVPAWRLHTVQATVALCVALVIASLTLTTSVSYSLVSRFAHTSAITAVDTSRAQVGVLVDTTDAAVPGLARTLAVDGIHASFAVGTPTVAQTRAIAVHGDQALPRLPGGGLVRWLDTRGELHHLIGHDGRPRHFLYASDGPSIGQWLFAHHAGGKLVAGAVSLRDADDALGRLHAGEVVQLDVADAQQLRRLLPQLVAGLRREHLQAVPVGRLVRDAGAAVLTGATRVPALTLADVDRAAAALDGVAHRTPVLTSRTLDQLVGAQVWLKAEMFQRGGSFKFRGAYTAISSLSPSALDRGVCTASSGNHAQAVAIASALCGTRATILMPRDAPALKRAATEGNGAQVIEFDRYGEDREQLLAALSAQRGLEIVHPYDNPQVMAGQGTVARELLAQRGELDLLVVPVGGGGLISGCATVVSALAPRARVVGVEPAASDDVARSLASGRRERVKVGPTIADGQQTPTPGVLTWPVIRTLVDAVVTVTDAQIVAAMRFCLERLKLVVEPSGASGLAALLAGVVPVGRARRIGVVLSGGNLGADRLAQLLGAGTTLEA